MRQDDYNTRFSGTQRLYGKSGLESLSKARVMVVGIGGVGTWVTEAFARSGIGTIHLVDMDDICVTNVNRQLHAITDTIGLAKVDAMEDRITQINPDCNVVIHETFLTPDNVSELIEKDVDWVIDATDSVNAKAAIIGYCKRNKIKVITVGGAGGQIDPTQIKVADLSRTIQDPLAAKVRNTLRRHYNFSRNPKRSFNVPCVFSTEQLRYPNNSGDVCFAKPKDGTPTNLDCNTGFGASVNVTATFGFFAASVVINKITQTS